MFKSSEVTFIFFPTKFTYCMTVLIRLDPFPCKIVGVFLWWAAEQSNRYQACTVNLWSGIFIQMCMQLYSLHGWRISQFSTMNFSIPDFLTMKLWTMGLKSSWLNTLRLKNPSLGLKSPGLSCSSAKYRKHFKYCWTLIVSEIITKINQYQDPNFMIVIFWKWWFRKFGIVIFKICWRGVGEIYGISRF